MLMGAIWISMVVISIFFACANGTASELGNAALEGAEASLEFCISVGGAICLWCGVMELMKRCGLSAALGRILRPPLKRLFPESAGREEIMEPLAANVSANLLGLGNAATPMGTGYQCRKRQPDAAGGTSERLLRHQGRIAEPDGLRRQGVRRREGLRGFR